MSQFESAGSEDRAEGADLEEAELRARIEALEEEAQQLRAAYATARRSQYRRAALGLAVIGVLAAAGGAVIPQAREVLLSLAGIGLFAAVLTLYLTPDRFVAASIVAHVQQATGETYEDMIRELGLQRTQVFLPTASETGPPAWLFVPHHPDWSVPDGEQLEARFLATEEPRQRGLSIRPAGAGLFDELERSVTGPLADSPGALGRQLGDALVEQFELADAVDVDSGDGRLTFAVTEPAFSRLDAIDHPISSFLGVGAAHALGTPVTLSVDGDSEVGTRLTLRWERAAEESESA